MRLVLSLDGGGARGIITAALLHRMWDYLPVPDLLAGTSTGGLIALALSAGIPAKDVVDLYRQRAGQIFSRTWTHQACSLFGLAESKYSADGVERVLDDLFGGRRLQDASTRVMVTSYDLHRARPKVFKSWQADDAAVLMSQAARATSAAPVYFPPAGQLVDGGVWANNPAVCAYVEARALWGQEDILVLSVGTGDTRKAIPAARAAGWGAAGWLPALSSLFMDSGTGAVDYQMNVLLGTRYMRVQPDMAGLSDAMDLCSPAHLEDLVRRAYAVPLDWLEQRLNTVFCLT